MSLDDMHDALNLLDDDMVEAVDALRSRKKKRKVHWVRWISLAACLCIAVISLYGVGRLFSTQNDGAAEYVGEGNKNDNEMHYGNPEEGEDQLTGGTGTATALVLLEIKTLEETGFTGEVVEAGEALAFSQGDILKVTYAEKRLPDSMIPLQEGDRVWVTYSPNHGEQNCITAHKITVDENEE